MAARVERTTWGYLGAWLVLAGLTVVLWRLGSALNLETGSLPLALGLAGAKTMLVTLFFLHWVERYGARSEGPPV